MILRLFHHPPNIIISKEEIHNRTVMFTKLTKLTKKVNYFTKKKCDVNQKKSLDFEENQQRLLENHQTRLLLIEDLCKLIHDSNTYFENIDKICNENNIIKLEKEHEEYSNDLKIKIQVIENELENLDSIDHYLYINSMNLTQDNMVYIIQQ